MAAPAPQPVKILPDPGRLAAWPPCPAGRTREALVSWVKTETGLKRRLVDHEPARLPEARIRRMPGTDYTAIEAVVEHVEHTPESAAEGTGPARLAPPGWPAQVLPPDDPEWVRSATAWLLDILRRTTAPTPTSSRCRACRHGSRPRTSITIRRRHGRGTAPPPWTFAVAESPEVIEQVLAVNRAEKERLAAVREDTRAVRRALAAQSR
jgi:hypothetical protein